MSSKLAPEDKASLKRNISGCFKDMEKSEQASFTVGIIGVFLGLVILYNLMSELSYREPVIYFSFVLGICSVVLGIVSCWVAYTYCGKRVYEKLIERLDSADSQQKLDN